MDVVDPFPTLQALQARHRRLLQQRRAEEPNPEFLDNVTDFIYRGQATGVLLDGEEDRWNAQNLLDYWSNELLHLEREPPDATLADYDPAQAPYLADSLCPYLGLDAFGTQQQAYFFGREKLVAQMVTMLADGRFLAIIGASGSGKSSAAQAGLLPRLQAGELPHSDSWHYFPRLVPGSHPLENLARLLRPPGVPSGWIRETAAQLRQSDTYLTELVNERCQGETAVLLVDQFEELFTLCLDEAARHAFADNLLHFVQNEVLPHRLILTMRTDFENNLMRLEPFSTLYTESHIRAMPMNASELHQAIAKPAQLVGLKFEDGLIDQLVRDILGEPAGLPLLQFTLLKLWEQRERNRITWDAYRRLGGGREALANSANTLYESLSLPDRQTARQILLHVVQSTQDVNVTRDRVLRQSLYGLGQSRQQVNEVLEQFIDARLIHLTEGDTPDDDQLEIAHEALVRSWPRLVGWLEEERVRLRHRLRLTSMAEQWDNLGRDESALLRGLLLEEALQHSDLNELETTFVEASVAAVEAERQAELAQAQRFAQRLGALSIALALVFVIALAAGLWAMRNGQRAQNNAATAVANEAEAERLRLTAEAGAVTAEAARLDALSSADLLATAEAEAVQQQQIAETERDAAQANANAAQAARATAEANARLAAARELAAAAVAQLDSSPPLSLLLALEAMHVTVDVGDPPPAEATDALYRALQASQLQQTLAGHTDWVSAVAFSPDGQRVATGSYDTAVKIWNANTGQEILTLNAHNSVINDIAFNPDGSLMASAGNDGLIIIWDTATWENVAAFRGQNDGAALVVAFHPNGNLLAAGYQNGTARIWQSRQRTSLLRQLEHTRPVNGVAFSPDGAQFVTASSDGTIVVQQTSNGRPIYSIAAELKGDGEPVAVYSVAFSPDGSQLAAARENGSVRIWERQTLVQTLTGHSGFVFSLAYSGDGRRLVSGGGDGTARLWNVDTGQSLYTLSGHSGGVTAVTFDANEGRIVTASQDGTAKIWNADPGVGPVNLSRHTAAVRSLVYSADGALILTAGEDNSAMLWDAASGSLRHALIAHNATVNDVALHPDGTLAATASEDFNVRRWDVETGELLFPFYEHDDAVTQVAFHPDGRLLATLTSSTLRLWDIEIHEVVWRQSLEATTPSDPTLAFSPDGTLLATSIGSAVTLWDVSAQTAIGTLDQEDVGVQDVAFSPDGALLATANSDGTITIWDRNTLSPRQTFVGHSGPVTAVAFSPDGTLLATAGADRTAKLWQVNTGQALRTIVGHTSGVTVVAFSPSGDVLATASNDSTVQLNPLPGLEELISQGWQRLTRPLTPAECAQYLHGRACVTLSLEPPSAVEP